jgi:acyl-CoA synthetase (AMP-forming)/AMP-acid ligase II
MVEQQFATGDRRDRPTTIARMLAPSVALHGRREAIVMTGDAVTYEELDRRTAKLARALLAIGAGKGTRIALMAPDGILWLTAFLAGARIGALVAMVSTLATPPELAHILRNSDAQILIGVRRFLRHDYAETLTAAIPGLADGTAGSLRLAGAPYLRSIWLDDSEGLSWAGAIGDLVARADQPDAPDEALLAEIENEVVSSDDAAIIYTSGSTSLPKAVVHCQRNLAIHSPEIAEHYLIRDHERLMPLLPLFWVGGLTIALAMLSVGGVLVYPDSPRTEDVLDGIERLNVNRINTWGPQLGRLREAVIARGIDIGKIIGFGDWRDKAGNVIPPQLFVNALGMSESFGPHSSEHYDVRLPEDKAGSSGRATSGYERRAVDPETGEEVGVGEIGELQLRGGALMTGFYKVERDKVFTRDGWYATSDRVSFDADGYLYFHSRQGDMLKMAGANVSRLEVQAALASLGEVDLPIVVGLPDEEVGQLVVAAVVPAAGAQPTEESLTANLRETLSSYKIPRRIIVISAEDVQWTPSNKVKYPEMGELIAKRIAEAAATAPN